MTDFQLFVRTQRIMWIKRLIIGESKMGWKQYFKYLTRKVGGLLLLFSNVTMELLELSLPAFYMNMLEIWVGTKDFLLKKQISKRNEIIFNNKFIRIEGHIYYDESLLLRNIYKVHHIVDREGKIKSSHEFQRMGLNDFEINEIKQIVWGIPSSWKAFLNTKNYPNIDTELSLEFVFNEKVYSLNEITSKKIYDTLLNMRTEKSYAMRNLEQVYGIFEKDIQRIFLRPRKSTLNSRLREFQFKMLYDLIYTNKHLYIFKIVASNLCSFCNKYEESYQHLFLSCEKIRSLWEDCGDLFNLPDIKNLDWKGIHVGIIGSNVGEGQLLNHIILLIKHMIFVYSRTKIRPPTPQEVKKRILENRQEERKLAKERGTLTYHFRKWENFILRDGEANASI